MSNEPYDFYKSLKQAKNNIFWISFITGFSFGVVVREKLGSSTLGLYAALISGGATALVENYVEFKRLRNEIKEQYINKNHE